MSTRQSVFLACLAIVGLSSLAVVGAAGAEPTAGFAYDGEAMTLNPATGQVVEGTTNLEAGTTVAVRLQSTSGSPAFLRSEAATVGEDGAFEVTFNLSQLEPGSTATASVTANGTTLASAPVEIVEEPSPSASPTETPGQPGFGLAVALVAVIAAVLVRDR